VHAPLEGDRCPFFDRREETSYSFNHFESCLLAVFALILAAAMDTAFLPLINQLIGRELSFNQILNDV